jgi:5-methylcytosine-specific restriction endonuclease McrA
MSFEKNKNWKGGATRYRKLAFERYNLEKICSVCGSIENIIVHHIDENRRNNAIENFQIMCNPCHTSHHRKGFTKKRKEKIN